MGSSREEPNKGIDATAGGLVWVRRRNGSWWPGQILGPDELPEGCVPTPRSGTPVKLLGREDASVDWYNLEKSKRVKAFHCEEYNNCIRKVKASSSHLNKRGAKYARREDAILHALELENARLGKEHPGISATPETQDAEHHHIDEPPSASHHSEESEDEERVNSSGDASDLGQEVSLSRLSVDGSDHVVSADEEPKQPEAENDSEDDGSEGVKRMRGLEDLGMGVASTLEKKRSKVGHIQELLKRKKHRPLKKVMESATMVPVPVISKQLSIPTGEESDESKKTSSVQINNISDSNGVSYKNGTLSSASKRAGGALLKHKQKDNLTFSTPSVPENGSLQKLFDVPLAEQKNSAGLGAVISDASRQAQVVDGAQSSQISDVEATSLGNEAYNEFGPTHSGTENVSQMIEKGTFEWRLKGKRNSRSRKEDLDNKGQTYVAGADREGILAGSSGNVGPQNLGLPLVSDSGGYRVKSRPNTGIQVDSHTQRSTMEQPAPQRLLPLRQSRFTVNPKYDNSDYSLDNRIAVTGLYDVNIEVKTSYRPQHVPYISLMSKLTGRPIIGHPLTVKVLKDGSCDNVTSTYDLHSNRTELEYDLNRDVSALGNVGKQRGRGRPRNKKGSYRVKISLSKSSKLRRNGLLSKKTRKLSSLTGSQRQSHEEMKPVVEKLKGPSIACVPLKIVFSRINAALTGTVRAPPRLNATSSM